MPSAHQYPSFSPPPGTLDFMSKFPLMVRCYAIDFQPMEQRRNSEEDPRAPEGVKTTKESLSLRMTWGGAHWAVV